MRVFVYASMHSCMMTRDNNCEMPGYAVAAWESALDLMLQEVTMSVVPRYQGHGAHARRPGRVTALWKKGVGVVIAPVLREYPDWVEGLWGWRRPGVMTPGNPYSKVHPESSTHVTVSHVHAGTTPRRRPHDRDVSHPGLLIQRQPPDDRGSAI